MSEQSSEPASPYSVDRPSQHIESGFIQPIGALLHATSHAGFSNANSPLPREKSSSSGNSLHSERASPRRLTNLFDKYPKTFFKAESPEYVVEEARRSQRGQLVEERVGEGRVVEVRELPPRVRSESVSHGSARVVSEVELRPQRRSCTPSSRARTPPQPQRVSRERLVEVLRERPVPVERFVDVYRDVVVDVPVERTIETERVTEVRVACEVQKVVEIPVEEVYEVPVERLVERPVEVLRRVEVPVERVVERLVEVLLEDVVVRKVYLDVDERDLHLYPDLEREPTRLERRRPTGPILPGRDSRAAEVVELPTRVEHVSQRAQHVERLIEAVPETLRESVRTVERVVERPLHYEAQLERRVEVLVERVVEVPVERVVEVPVEVRVKRPVLVERLVEVPVPVEVRRTTCREEAAERVEEVESAELAALIAQRREEAAALTAANAQRREDLRALASEAEGAAAGAPDALLREHLLLLSRLFALQSAPAR